MPASKPAPQTSDIKQKMHDLALAVVQESTKYYKPSTKGKNNKDDFIPAANVACLRIIKFRQLNPFGIMGIIHIVRNIRSQLKKLSYSSDFVNNMTIYLALALMRTKIST